MNFFLLFLFNVAPTFTSSNCFNLKKLAPAICYKKNCLRQTHTDGDLRLQAKMFTSKMYVVMLYLVMGISSAAGADQFLAHLYGMESKNYVLVCLKAAVGRRERACAGALLGADWVGVRAGCLRNHPQEYMIVLRQTEGERCEDVTHGYSTWNTRNVQDHLYHSWSDLVLVLLDRPYGTPLDVHPNTTEWTVQQAFQKHGLWRWMQWYMEAYARARDPDLRVQHIAQRLVSIHSPFLITFLAIILPSLIYALVFIYVIFYSNKKAPFKAQYDKK